MCLGPRLMGTEYLKLNLLSLKIRVAAVNCLWQMAHAYTQTVHGHFLVLVGLDKIQARDISDTLIVLSAEFLCPGRLFGGV